MILKKIFFISILLFQIQISLAQTKLQLVDSIQINKLQNITDFATDDFNNLYFINNYTELNKYDYQTQKIKSFSNHTFLEDLNTQNALQITLKTAFFNLLILDNQLNPIQDLIQFPVEFDFSPTLVALVDNNYLWGYDPILQRLILWNYQNNNILRQSTILSNKTGDEFYAKLRYNRDKIYLIGQQRVLIFDEFANLKEVIPFYEFDQIELIKDDLIYTFDNQLFLFNLKTKQTKTVELNRSFTNFAVNKQHIFVIDKKVVYIYKYQIN